MNMNGWSVVWRKSNRHKWIIICTTLDPLYRDALVINELRKFKNREGSEDWQVGYFDVPNCTGGLVDTDSYSQKTNMSLQLTPNDDLPEPLPEIVAMMECKYNYSTARYELNSKGFDYSTDFPIEGA